MQIFQAVLMHFMSKWHSIRFVPVSIPTKSICISYGKINMYQLLLVSADRWLLATLFSQCKLSNHLAVEINMYTYSKVCFQSFTSLLCITMDMAVASGWASRVLAQPLFSQAFCSQSCSLVPSMAYWIVCDLGTRLNLVRIHTHVQ